MNISEILEKRKLDLMRVRAAIAKHNKQAQALTDRHAFLLGTIAQLEEMLPTESPQEEAQA